MQASLSVSRVSGTFHGWDISVNSLAEQAVTLNKQYIIKVSE